ncbi:MAG TPA: TfoX/Sxy family protein [Egibacteraceae bacterium]|jgi:TfoX/Sxy family transcriptional regulator of competence genes|nr:TfoX/Sxy family protein [Egibacteraceae bacterium]
MAYDTELADRIREAFAGAGVDAVEQSMFGGHALMVRGHMTVGVLGDDLIVRVGRERYEDALARPAARPMDFTGRPMTGMVFVAAAGLDDVTLDGWVRRGLSFTRSLPPK